MTKRTVFLPLLLISILLAGCSGGPAGMPPLFPCSITVTQEGVPLEGAVVRMVNLSDEAIGMAWTPIATTDANGVARMMTNAQYDGVAAGKYRIVVEKFESEPSRLGPPPPVDSPEYEAWSHRSAAETRAQYALVNSRYSSSNSPHEVEITRGGRGANDHTIDVGVPVRVRQ